jgi:two-component system nitrogen regulation response regulator GlnG
VAHHHDQHQASTPSATPLKSVDIIGESPAMQEVFRAIGRLSQSHITVLINGESGTGKELVAHALHQSFATYVVAPLLL